MEDQDDDNEPDENYILEPENQSGEGIIDDDDDEPEL